MVTGFVADYASELEIKRKKQRDMIKTVDQTTVADIFSILL